VDAEDFADDDMLVARCVQRVLIGLELHAAVLRRWQTRVESADRAGGALAETTLTGRELAVLSLLADGLTAASIGHRLNVTSRTVSKHLEHIYAKLHVSDRLSAVLRGPAWHELTNPLGIDQQLAIPLQCGAARTARTCLRARNGSSTNTRWR